MELLFTFKRCFTCNRKYPLILFNKNNVKYQIPSDKGRLTNCRFCTVKELYKYEGRVVRYNFERNKPQVISIELKIKNILKEFFK
jgi:hypothetical protein